MFEQMKGLSPKKKIEYYIQYYGAATAVILIMIIAVTSFVVGRIRAKDVAYIFDIAFLAFYNSIIRKIKGNILWTNSIVYMVYDFFKSLSVDSKFHITTRNARENGKISGNADVRCISHNRVGITLITRHQYGNS